jgi:hypothetical protein
VDPSVTWLYAHLSSRFPEVWVSCIAAHCVARQLIPQALLEWLAAQARATLSVGVTQQLQVQLQTHGLATTLQFLLRMAQQSPDAFACCLGGLLDWLTPEVANAIYTANAAACTTDSFAQVTALVSPSVLVREPRAFLKLLSLLMALSGNTRLWDLQHPHAPPAARGIVIAQPLLDHTIQLFLCGLNGQMVSLD